jgi:hypothetical protein
MPVKWLLKACFRPSKSPSKACFSGVFPLVSFQKRKFLGIYPVKMRISMKTGFKAALKVFFQLI